MDLEWCTLRPGNLHSTEGCAWCWRRCSRAIVGVGSLSNFAATRRSAKPELYELLEAEGIGYAMTERAGRADSGYWLLFEGDLLVLEADTHALSSLVARAKLELIHGKELARGEAREDDLAVVEAVVTPSSAMIGSTVEQLALRERFGLNLLAVSRSGRRIAQRLRRVRFRDGDLLVLQGRAERIDDKLAALGCLPLAERNVPLGRPRNRYLPAANLGVAMVLVTMGTVSVPVGFFGAAVAVLAAQVLTLKEAYDAIEWPVLILFGALIPVSEALQTTGATELMAGWLSAATQHLPPLGALGLMLIAAMALTPFLNNAATVLVMAPIGASLAGQLGLSVDPFLMA
ncbi:MAG: family permease, partial [Geminicoccaceae bacterium]|nr:family permease [Geminicoccaceae bacterium]